MNHKGRILHHPATQTGVIGAALARNGAADGWEVTFPADVHGVHWHTRHRCQLLSPSRGALRHARLACCSGALWRCVSGSYCSCTHRATSCSRTCRVNSYALGRPAGPAANGGLNFYLNFADVHTIQYQGPLGGYWVSPVPNGFDHSRRELSAVPFFEDGHYYRVGLRYLAQHPAALGAALDNFVEASGLGRQLYWPNWPGHERLLRGYAHSFSALVLLPALLLLAALGAPRLRRRLPHAALVVSGCCVLGLVPMYLFLGDPRVRVPFDPLWIVLAGLAVELLYRQFARKGAPDDRSARQEGREPAPLACLRSRAETHASI